jgi:hypothetical protein
VVPGSPSPVGRKPGICQTGQLVTREGPEGSNPSPGAYFEEPNTSLKALAGESRVVVSNELLMNAARDFVHRSGKIRIVTEITNDNIAACKEMMKDADVRHLEGIRSTFAVSEKEYFGHVTDEPNGQHSHAIYSNVRNYVDSQQYLFETLWKKAIPSKQRIREIQEGAKREVVEIIRDPVEIQKN